MLKRPTLAQLRKMVTRGPRLLGSFAGSWRFEETAPGQTRVGFRYHLQARPWWLAWLLTPILGWVFQRDTRKRLVALKKAVEQRGVLRGYPESQKFQCFLSLKRPKTRLSG
jgi:hypothetical protein